MTNSNEQPPKTSRTIETGVQKTNEIDLFVAQATQIINSEN